MVGVTVNVGSWLRPFAPNLADKKWANVVGVTRACGLLFTPNLAERAKENVLEVTRFRNMALLFIYPQSR